MIQWDKKHLQKYVEENLPLVQIKPVPLHWPKHRFSILKYKRKVFYKALWTPELCEFRGTVVNEHFDIVLRPPTKIFNRGELGTDIADDEECVFSQKINGFMCSVTVKDGKVLLSTTGSMDSPFSALAWEWVKPFCHALIERGEGMTYTFEVVDPTDPHIIPEQAGLYLLCVRANVWNTPHSIYTEEMLDRVAADIGFAKTLTGHKEGGGWIRRPNWFSDTFGNVVGRLGIIKHEGFVAYGKESGTILKLKSPYYLTTKFLGRMKDKRFLEFMEKPEDFKKKLDEEFYSIIDFLAENRDYFLTLDEQCRMRYIRDFFAGDII